MEMEQLKVKCCVELLFCREASCLEVSDLLFEVLLLLSYHMIEVETSSS